MLEAIMSFFGKFNHVSVADGRYTGFLEVSDYEEVDGGVELHMVDGSNYFVDEDFVRVDVIPEVDAINIFYVDKPTICFGRC